MEHGGTVIMVPASQFGWRRARSWRLVAVATAVLTVTSAQGRAQEPDRGAYLAYVTGCVGCHSPHDDAGNVLPGRLLSGGDHPIRAAGGAGIYPPNITPDASAGIGGWTENQVVAVLARGEVPGGRILSSAMPWSTQYDKLSPADMQAIAQYVLSVPAVQAHAPARAGDSGR